MKKKKVIVQQVLSAVLATALVGSNFSVSGSLHLNVKAAENITEKENENSELNEVENGSSTERTAEEPEILYSGKDGNLDWSIDENGLLIITGDGDYISKDWLVYASNIKEAKITVHNITNISGMFRGCSSLTSLDLSNFDTSNVTGMSSMFSGCSGLTSLDLSNFDTHNVMNVDNMFSGCSSLTSLNLSKFDTSKVRYMDNMFSECSNLTSLDLSNFDTSNVMDMYNMFRGCSGLTSLDLSNFNTSNVTSMKNMFWECSGLIRLNLSNFNTSNVTDMSSMFSGCSNLTSLNLSNFNTSNVTSMSSMFSGCSGLTNLDLSNFNISNVTDMSSMFSGCSGLTNLDLSNFNISNVTNMSSMFSGCSNLTSLNLSNFNTSNVTNMGSMFSGCSGLTNLDLSNFDTSNVTNMGSMFSGCSGLTNLDLSNFDTSNVIGMSSMFLGCSDLTNLDLSNFNTSNVLVMDSMFSGCSGLTSLDLSNFNTSKVIDMGSIFDLCYGIEKIVVPANIKEPILLPQIDNYYWLNEKGEICTTIDINSEKPMIYIKLKDINNTSQKVIFEDNFVYNGKSQERTFDLVIESGEKKLEEEIDYTYTITGNIGTDAGDYKLIITITGIGDYTGSLTIEKDWKIAKAKEAPNMPENSREIEIQEGLKVSDSFLVENKGWQWIETDRERELPTRAGEILEITAEYKGEDAANYEITTQTVTITMIEDIKNTDPIITFENNLIYNGELQERTFALVIQSGERELVEGVDYTYTVIGNTETNAGDYKLTIIITGKGSYKGSLTIEKDWKIAKAEKAPNMPESNRTATIREGLKVNDLLLTENTGWQWVEADRQTELPTKAGEVLEITAEYIGKDAANYEVTIQTVMITMIEDIKNTDPIITFENNLIYNGELQERTFALVIQSGERELVEGVDYTYTVTGNTETNAGDYKLTVIVTGKGSYKGSFTIEKDWKIVKAEKAPNMPESNRTVTIQEGLKVSDLPLIENTGWQWAEADKQTELPTKAGEVLEITAEYKGGDAANYEKTTQIVTITMIEESEPPVEKEDIKNATPSITFEDNLIYNGKPQERIFDLVVQSEEKKLTEGTDYTYIITGNTAKNAGDYKLTITITGIGDYTGSLTIEKDWKIAKAEKAPNMPESSRTITIQEGLKVSDLPLIKNTNWQWAEADRQTELPTKAGITWKATAEYVGEDAANYEKTTQIVTITMIEESEPPVEKEDIQNTNPDIIFEDNFIYNGNLQERTFDLIVQSEEKKLTEGTDYTYTITGNKETNAGNYKFTITITGIGDYTGSLMIEKDWKIAKAEKAPNMPESSRTATIQEGLKVSDLPLNGNTGWQWTEADRQTELPTKAGITWKATAEYVGGDAANYEIITCSVTITMIENNTNNTKPNPDENGGNTGNGNNGNNSGGNNSGNNNSGSNNNNSNNIGNNTGSNIGNGSSTNTGSSGSTGTTGNTTQPTQTESENKEENNPIDTNNPNTTIETKEDGTTVETTIQTTENGSKIETIKETKTDGSITEIKTVTTEDDDTILTITKEMNQQGTEKKAVISTGTQGTVIISDHLLEALIGEEAIEEYRIEITAPTIEAAQKLRKNTVVTIAIPAASDLSADDIFLTQDSIQAAKEIGKGLKIIIITEKSSHNTEVVETENSKNYTVTIPAKQLSKIDSSIQTISIVMSIENQQDKTTNPDTKNGLKTALADSGSTIKKTCVISTAENIALENVGMKLKVDVTKTAEITAGSTVYLYKYNAKTGKLEEMANSKQTVASDGTVMIDGYSGIDYIVSAKKLTGTSVVTMEQGVRFQIKKRLIKKGKKVATILILPDTISTGNKFGTEKATIVYKSSNPKLASISKKGVISAKKAGKVTLTVVITLENGRKITKKKKITIQ